MLSAVLCKITFSYSHTHTRAHVHAHAHTQHLCISDMISDIMLALVVLTFVIDIPKNNYYDRSTLLCMILT